MNTEERTFRVLEWNIILESLAKHATSEAGKARCLNTPIYSNINEIYITSKIPA